MKHKKSHGRDMGPNKPRQKHLARGQSLMEYVVACAALAFILFVPIQDNPASPGNPRTTIQIVLNAFHTAYLNISHAISLPN